MRKFRRRALETIAWVVVVPAVVVSLFNPDIARLAVGAFGPPPDAGMLRILLLGLVVAILALWDSWRVADHRAVWREAGLLVVAIISIATVADRQSDISRRDVEFQGNGIRIAATIYEPLTQGRHPAMVFVAGSAPFKRGLYALWAEHLARRGIVSIVPDKRGVGGTGGEFERRNNTSKANLAMLAGDAVAALEFASRQRNIDPACLGLFGVSQGGWIVPMAAVESPLARFIIMVTGPAVSVHEEGEWSDLRGDDERAAKLSRTDAERVIDTVAAGGVDPRTRLAALKIPGLWLFGSDDASIPTRKSVKILDSLNRTVGTRFTFDSVPGYGHLVMGRAGRILPRVAPSSWRSLDEWLLQQGLTKSPAAATERLAPVWPLI